MSEEQRRPWHCDHRVIGGAAMVVAENCGLIEFLISSEYRLGERMGRSLFGVRWISDATATRAKRHDATCNTTTQQPNYTRFIACNFESIQ